MTEALKAVFLSYASQDALAARRICDALRADGLEVWFDQSELRGGDAWDQKIRQQIRDCALFLPVISINTATRHEGYFRLEWNLADQRTHMIARDRAFIVPICIDDTPNTGTDVPESFVRVQWTRLAGEDPPASFCQRVAALLAGTEKAGSVLVPSGTAMPIGSYRSTLRWAGVAAVTVLVVIALIIKPWQQLAPKPTTLQPASSVMEQAVIAVPEKSVAVLPFADMSKKHDQEYFSDGLAEELLDLLAQVPDLRVPGRTSSFSFKGKSDDIQSIAQKLRVANVLEGSVRKSGSTLRVTVQLIRADSGYQLWSKTFDRDLKDIFKVQDEVALAVVEALKIKLAPVPQASSRRTSNTEAYNQFLLARQFHSRAPLDDRRRAADAFRKAIALDPNYAAAYAGLAIEESFIADLTADTTGFERARADAEKAVALAPDEADGYAARGWLRLTYTWDWAGAQSDLAKALALDPTDGRVQGRYGYLLEIRGQLPEAIAAYKKAIQLEPLSNTAWENLGNDLMTSKDYGAADHALRRALEIQPKSSFAINDFGTLQLLSGQATEALATFGKIDQEGFRLTGIAMAEHTLGNAKKSQEALDNVIAKQAEDSAYQIAQVYAWRGKNDDAFEWLERAYRQRDGGLPEIKVDPLLNGLHADPRFKAMLHKINLPE